VIAVRSNDPGVPFSGRFLERSNLKAFVLHSSTVASSQRDAKVSKGLQLTEENYADSPFHVGFRPTQIGTSLIAVNLPNETNDGPYPPVPAPSELGVRAEL
jgi:hypothetical protein